MRIVDLSVALKAGIASDPPYMLPSIEYVDHREGAKQFTQVFPGLKVEQLPDGEGPAVERVTISTHNGTHLDAPWHFASTMDGGKPSWKIDQVPLEWFFSAGVKLDFRTKPDGYVCKADDVKHERLERLVEVVQRSAAERNAQRVGLAEQVLVEGASRTDPALLRGRTRRNTTVNFAGSAQAGELADVVIEAATSTTLRGRETSLVAA